MNINMSMAHGKGCHGTMGMGSTGNFDMVSTGMTLWLRLDAVFLKTLKIPASASAALTGKYLKTTSNNAQFATLSNFCDPATFAGGTTQGNSTYTRGGTGVVNGVPVLILIDSADQSRIYVATTGPTRVLRVSGPSTAAGNLDFLYNTPVQVTAPPTSEVVDAATVGL